MAIEAVKQQKESIEPVLFLKKSNGRIIQLTATGAGKIISIIPLEFSSEYKYYISDNENLILAFICKIIPDVQKGADPETFPTTISETLFKMATEKINANLFQHIKTHHPTSNWKQCNDFEVPMTLGNYNLLLLISNIKAQE